MSISKEEILTQTRQVLMDLFELDENLLAPKAKLYEDLDVDSIDAVDLMIEIKKITGIQMQPEAFKEVQTLQDVVDTIYQLSQ